MYSEGDKGRDCKGRYSKGPDCFVDMVLPVKGWQRAGLAIEVNGPDHGGTLAIKRDTKRLDTARREFEVLVGPANAGHTLWYEKIDDTIIDQIKAAMEVG